MPARAPPAPPPVPSETATPTPSAAAELGGALPVQVPQTHHVALARLTDDQVRSLATAGEPWGLQAMLAPAGMAAVVAGGFGAGAFAWVGALRAGISGMPLLALMVGASAVGAVVSAGAVGLVGSLFERVWAMRRRSALRARARRWRLDPAEVERLVAILCPGGAPLSLTQSLVELEHLCGRRLRPAGQGDDEILEWAPVPRTRGHDDEDDDDDA